MTEDQPRHSLVFQHPQRQPCVERRLVLMAVGIPADIFQQDRVWALAVADHQAQAASDELDSYNRENAEPAQEREVARPNYPYAWLGVISYALVIGVIALQKAQSAFGWDWLVIGRMRAGDVVNGEVWRVLTALTLHVDLGHLLGNLVFGGLFGILAGRSFGGGVAWLAIVMAGGIGNALNAWMQSPDHSSIGASTAVFATLGILVANALKGAFRGTESLFRRFSPLIAGSVLMALTGVGGEQTDVGAHFAGFISGFSIGLVLRYAPEDWLKKEAVQAAAGILRFS